MSNQTSPHKQMLQSAQVHMQNQQFAAAAAAAAAALAIMKPMMSTNNPQLAQAYGLHGDALLGQALASSSVEEMTALYGQAAQALQGQVAVLEEGMLSPELLEARSNLGAALVEGQRYEEAVAVVEKARNEALELSTGESSPVGRAEYLALSCLLCDALAGCQRYGEAKSMLVSCFHQLQPHDYHQLEVAQNLQVITGMLAELIQMEAEASSQASSQA